MTIRVDIERSIDAPIEEVFDRLADLDGYDEWMSRDGLFRGTRKTSDGPVAEGTEFEDRSRMGRLSGCVTELDRPHRIGFTQVLYRRGSPAFESRPGYVLEETDHGTLVRHSARGDFHGVLKVLEPVTTLMARRERTRVLDSLQASLERGSTP